MNTKNFIVGGLVGGIVNFLLGWLFYGYLFADKFPGGDEMNIVYIFLGCLTFGLFLSYVFNKWAGISTASGGLNAGLIIGLFTGLWGVFFRYSDQVGEYSMMALTLGIDVVVAAAMGLCMGFVASKMK